MKLSMWMIANQLFSLDIDMNITEDAPVILKSARRAYATNCVHVYPEGDHVICNGEGNMIRLKNMDVTQAFEIIQGVFDFYQDWMEQMLLLAREKNYKEIIDQSWALFHNPLILLDGNNKVLGMSQQYDCDMVDDEWNYLSKYGYSSLNAVQHMRYHYGNIDCYEHGSLAYNFSNSRLLEYGGLTHGMYCNEIICGRITLLSRDRSLNSGDNQLLEKLVSILEPSLGQLYYETFLRNSNVFYSILFGKAYDEPKLQQQLHYQQWSLSDTFYLALLEIPSNGLDETPGNNMNLLMHTIFLQQPNCIVLKKTPYILVLSNKNIAKDNNMIQLFKDLTKNTSIRIGFSLPCDGLHQASYLYDQAEAALLYGALAGSKQSFLWFFDYAMDFMIEVPDLLKGVHACHPGIAPLFKSKTEHQDEMFDTLKAYLHNERSIAKTAAALFIHRNTTLYRIKKIKEILNNDLEDVYTRDYITLSMRILELHHRKNTSP